MEHPSTHRILKRPSAPGGFTLIEMLIVLFIILIISAIIFSGQANFDRTVALNNTAYDIALSLRQAQSFGLSSKAYFPTLARNVGYGLAFQSSQNASYLMFADNKPDATSLLPDAHPGDQKYTAADGVVQTYVLNNGLTIADFCAFSSSRVCSGSSMTVLSVSFIRPNSESAVKGCDASNNCASYSNACIKLVSRSGDARYVSVSRTGQIQSGLRTIDSNTCPP